MPLPEADRKAWEHLGRCEYTVKSVLHTLEAVHKRFDADTDRLVRLSVEDAIRQCRSCLAACQIEPL